MGTLRNAISGAPAQTPDREDRWQRNDVEAKKYDHVVPLANIDISLKEASMAIWQVDLHLIRSNDELPDTLEAGWQPPVLDGSLLLQAQTFLSEYLGEPWSITEQWLVFGPQNGSRVDIVLDPTTAGKLVIRFDTRDDAVQFPALMCRLAQKLDCLFFSADLGCFVEPNGATLAIALDHAHNAMVLRNLNIR